MGTHTHLHTSLHGLRIFFFPCPAILSIGLFPSLCLPFSGFVPQPLLSVPHTMGFIWLSILKRFPFPRMVYQEQTKEGGACLCCIFFTPWRGIIIAITGMNLRTLFLNAVLSFVYTYMEISVMIFENWFLKTVFFVVRCDMAHPLWFSRYSG